MRKHRLVVWLIAGHVARRTDACGVTAKTYDARAISGFRTAEVAETAHRRVSVPNAIQFAL